jgi:hypothetical protein
LGEKGILTLNIPPPVPHFLAMDPSAAKPGEIFGHQLGTEQELSSNLSPKGLLPEDQKDLAACMIDAVASPGRSSTSEAEGISNIEEFMAVIKELSDRSQSNWKNSAVQVDTQWWLAMRNSLA